MKLGGVSGIVEDINLRRTVLRDFDGNVHFVSHGSIDVASNYTRGQSRVNFTIVVAYTADLDRVFALIDGVGQEMATDAAYGKYIVEAPRAVGVDRLEKHLWTCASLARRRRATSGSLAVSCVDA